MRMVRWSLWMFFGWVLATGAVDDITRPSGARSAPAGYIAFVAQRADNWDLFVMSAEGGGLRQLTTTPIDERAPALSPDRKTIVYSTSNGDLWTVGLTSGSPDKIDLPKGVYNFPCWSPDGGEILFVGYEVSAKNEDADIMSYNFKTKKVQTVIHQTGIQTYPAFAGSRNRILYSTVLVGPGMQVVQQLWLYDLQKGQARQLLLSNANDIQADYSPRQERIAFASNREGSYDLWTTDVQGTAVTRVTSDPSAETNPRWSPDGTRLIFVSNRSGLQELWTVRPDGQDMRKLSPFGGEAVAAKDPDWK